MSAGPERTEPATPAPPTPPLEEPAQPAVTMSMAAFGGNESCPNCGARMAADQRYCLNCGHRRGDPRLPFMDAVVFMESMSAPSAGPGAPVQPPPPPGEPRSSSRMNANAALIAGVATLVLAIGVGFLIGRAGHENSTQAQAPQVIKVEGGGGGEATEGVGTEESTAGGATESSKGQGGSGGSATPGSSSGKATKKAQENAKEGAHGGTEGVEKVLHTASGVKLPEAEQEIGGSCEQGTAGCGNSGKFEGTFFE